MPFTKVNFRPGINREGTAYDNEGGWFDSNLVRFRKGLPEKIGGWSQLTSSNLTLPGVARAQHAFTSIAGEKYVAIGTSQGLFLYANNNLFVTLAIIILFLYGSIHPVKIDDSKILDHQNVQVLL